MATDIQGLIDTGRRKVKKDCTATAKKEIEHGIAHDAYQVQKVIECLERQVFSGTVLLVVDIIDGRIGNRKIKARVLKQQINIDEVDPALLD